MPIEMKKKKEKKEKKCACPTWDRKQWKLGFIYGCTLTRSNYVKPRCSLIPCGANHWVRLAWTYGEYVLLTWMPGQNLGPCKANSLHHVSFFPLFLAHWKAQNGSVIRRTFWNLYQPRIMIETPSHRLLYFQPNKRPKIVL